MLTARRRLDASIVHAWEQTKDDKPWECPACATEVSLKKGRIVVAHFAHKPPTSCEYGVGESAEHRRCKFEMFEALRSDPRVTKLQLERDLGTVRPDLSAFINGHPVAIEVQISRLSMDKIAYRTAEYAKKRISVLWLSTWREDLDSDQYAPRIWEKWLHATYFGRVYYWKPGRGAVLLPYHFDGYLIWVEERTFYVPGGGGDEETAGGYERASRRWRTPVLGPELNLLDDFMSRDRAAWVGGEIHVPSCRLFMDRSPAWWARRGGASQ